MVGWLVGWWRVGVERLLTRPFNPFQPFHEAREPAKPKNEITVRMKSRGRGTDGGVGTRRPTNFGPIQMTAIFSGVYPFLEFRDASCP